MRPSTTTAGGKASRPRRDREDGERDPEVAGRGAPAALGSDRDKPERNKKPGDLLRRDREPERDRGPSPIAIQPRDREWQRVEEIRASADGERDEARGAEQSGQEERSQAARSPRDHQRHRDKKARDVKIVRVPPERDHREQQ